MTQVYRLIIALAVIVMGAPLVTPAYGEYPERPVTVVAPFPPGGRTDLTARTVAEGLEQNLGVAVNVINKPGAGGVIGAKFVANSKPDGLTVGIFSSAVISAQYTVETGTDLGDYKVAALVEISPAAIAVKYDAPWKSLRELLDHAKKNPGTLKFGTIPGASAQVFSGGLVGTADVEMIMVPFKGDQPGVNALAGGHIDVHAAVPASYKSLREAKKIRILAVAAKERLSQLPNVPTFAEQGVDLVIGSFHAAFVPKDTPDEIVAKLEEALRKTMASKATTERMENIGLGPTFMDREGAKAFLVGHDNTYRTLIEKLGMMHKSKR